MNERRTEDEDCQTSDGRMPEMSRCQPDEYQGRTISETSNRRHRECRTGASKRLTDECRIKMSKCRLEDEFRTGASKCRRDKCHEKDKQRRCEECQTERANVYVTSAGQKRPDAKKPNAKQNRRADRTLDERMLRT